MAWAKRDFSLNQYNTAARRLIDTTVTDAEKDNDYTIVNNWRSIHAFPLNTFQNRLREKAREVDNLSTVAQRTKRLDSINKKLIRFDKMNLCQIQDIAGCRAIVNSISHANQLMKAYEESKLKHKLSKVNDYIQKPKDTGYRCTHLIYTYYSDKNDNYNGLKIEVQIRSILQHAWATAVETVDTFTQQSLKTNQGSDDWKRFFTLMGSAMALIEKSPLVPNTPVDKQSLKLELIDFEAKLQVRKTLENYGETLKYLEDPNKRNRDFHYYIMESYPKTLSVRLHGYNKANLPKAMYQYLLLEKHAALNQGNVVLVSADSMAALQRAYPNYFLDTKLFIQSLNQIIK